MLVVAFQLFKLHYQSSLLLLFLLLIAQYFSHNKSALFSKFEVAIGPTLLPLITVVRVDFPFG